MKRIVCDTSTLVSGFLYDGNERRLLEKATEGMCLLFTSKEIFKEFSQVISRPRFKLTPTESSKITKTLERITELVEPDCVVSAIKADESDNRILEAALAADADYIVSGDRHLLELKAYRGIKIVRTKQMLGLLE